RPDARALAASAGSDVRAVLGSVIRSGPVMFGGHREPRRVRRQGRPTGSLAARRSSGRRTTSARVVVGQAGDGSHRGGGLQSDEGPTALITWEDRVASSARAPAPNAQRYGQRIRSFSFDAPIENAANGPWVFQARSKLSLYWSQA